MSVPRVYTMITNKTGSGRVALLARKDLASPWQQVESCNSNRDAEVYAAQLEGDAPLRADVIDEWRAEDWGNDAPTTAPD